MACADKVLLPILDGGVTRRRLTDGSPVFDIVLHYDGDVVELPCVSERAALELARQIELATTIKIRILY